MTTSTGSQDTSAVRVLDQPPAGETLRPLADDQAGGAEVVKRGARLVVSDAQRGRQLDPGHGPVGEELDDALAPRHDLVGGS